MSCPSIEVQSKLETFLLGRKVHPNTNGTLMKWYDFLAALYDNGGLKHYLWLESKLGIALSLNDAADCLYRYEQFMSHIDEYTKRKGQ
ncbi:hypothetical protein KF728_09805 [Candidatus Obscuribacterales bacterium]|nr:hypothetical protein [Candidatus Obscuribacterales bacterium]